MIVPGGRRLVPSVTALVVGHLYSVDSNMGGSYSVHYKGKKKDGRHHFLRKRYSDTPRADYTFTDAEVLNNVYIIVPSDSYTEMLWDEERIKEPRHNRLEDATEAWFPPAEGTFSYKNLKKKGLLDDSTSTVPSSGG